MGLLAQTVQRLSTTCNDLIARLATDSFYVLRLVKESNNSGGTTKSYEPTTVAAYPCFYSLVPMTPRQREQHEATQRLPLVFYKFAIQSSVDIKVDDRLRLVARAPVAEKELEILRVAEPIGITREVYAVERAAK